MLLNGANPCNVYWQVGSSATLGTTTAFQGNLMALSSISLKNGATVVGRMLARNGAVTLINNVLNAANCGAPTTTVVAPGTPGTPGTPGAPGQPTGPGGSGGSGATPGPAVTPGSGSGSGSTPGTPGSTPIARDSKAHGAARLRHTPREDCTDGFTASVRGQLIAQVLFRFDGKKIAFQTSGPFQTYVVAPSPGIHRVTARVSFRDNTKAKTFRFRYRACAAGSLQPRRGPSRFTG